MVKPQDRYQQKFISPSISIESLPEERKVKKIHIDTDRFTITSLHTIESDFNQYEINLKNLYNNTLADSKVVSSYGDGTPQTEEGFANMVKKSSQRWERGNGLGAYIVTYNEGERENVAGWINIGDGDIVNTAEVAYIFNFDYHRNSTRNLKNVGYECIGGLLLYHVPANLYGKTKVNQTFNLEKHVFEGGQDFIKMIATARIDNLGSWKILQNCGFSRVNGSIEKWAAERYIYERDYSLAENEITDYSSQALEFEKNDHDI